MGLQKITNTTYTCSLAGLKVKIKIKFETEKYICTKNNTLNQLNEKWAMICKV